MLSLENCDFYSVNANEPCWETVESWFDDRGELFDSTKWIHCIFCEGHIELALSYLYNNPQYIKE